MTHAIKPEAPAWMAGRSLPKWARGPAAIAPEDAAAILGAEAFACGLLIPQQGHQMRGHRPTLAEARALADRLNAEECKGGRKALVFALHRGRYHAVPASWPD